MQGKHPVPFRTRQLSPVMPMVLLCGRVGRRQLKVLMIKMLAEPESFDPVISTVCLEATAEMVWYCYAGAPRVGIKSGRRQISEYELIEKPL